jgi:hypothetical protein
MVRRLHGLSQDPCGELEPAAGGRTLMVAMKRPITVERAGAESVAEIEHPEGGPARGERSESNPPVRF